MWLQLYIDLFLCAKPWGVSFINRIMSNGGAIFSKSRNYSLIREEGK